MPPHAISAHVSWLQRDPRRPAGGRSRLCCRKQTFGIQIDRQLTPSASGCGAVAAEKTDTSTQRVSEAIIATTQSRHSRYLLYIRHVSDIRPQRSEVAAMLNPAVPGLSMPFLPTVTRRRTRLGPSCAPSDPCGCDSRHSPCSPPSSAAQFGYPCPRSLYSRPIQHHRRYRCRPL